MRPKEVFLPLPYITHSDFNLIIHFGTQNEFFTLGNGIVVKVAAEELTTVDTHIHVSAVQIPHVSIIVKLIENYGMSVFFWNS